ncbi:MAG: MFS transporter [SAR202 cluster bacterium]|nr:MFS transporter [SAR202 cluster bacterium]
MTEKEQDRGLRMMTWQAIAGSGAGGVISGGFVTAFALLLGANNFQIGAMTAIPFVAQMAQILVVILVEKTRMRKAICTVAYFLAYLIWIPTALIPFMIDVPSPGAVAILLVFVSARGIVNAFVNSTWNSWQRDLLRPSTMGRFLSERMKLATIAAVVAGIAAAIYIDYWKEARPPSEELLGYSLAIIVGIVLFAIPCGIFVSLMPEPRMAMPEGKRPPIAKTLSAPLRDANYRRLVSFLFLWNSAAYLAIPFFAVYMLVRLEMPVSFVVSMGVFSQVTNILFLKVWGRFVDKYGGKAVMSLTYTLHMFVVLGWAFVSVPSSKIVVIPMIIFLHGLLGIANAGINVSTMTVRIKLAPPAQSMAYLTSASLAGNVGAGVGPLLGGFFADFFSVREFEIALRWIDPSRNVEFPAVHLTGFDFLFVVSFVFGMAMMNILSRVKEEGEVKSEVVLTELMEQTRGNLRALQPVPVIGIMSHMPSRLKHVPHFGGLDIAIGVTTYQIAASTRSAVEAVVRGKTAAKDIGHKVSNAVSKAVDQVEDVGKHGAEVARHATVGALHAVGDVGENLEKLTHEVVTGTLDALAKSSIDPTDALWGVGYGSVQGATAAGADPTEVAAQAIESARKAAGGLGLTEDHAIAIASKGAMDAATEMDGNTASQVKQKLETTAINLAEARKQYLEGESQR